VLVTQSRQADLLGDGLAAGERELTQFSEWLGRFVPKEAEEHGIGWAIQKDSKELKAETHGPRLRVRKRSRVSPGGSPGQD
jgi:hypothetical protein